ncbi:MAG TPA: ATP-binding protein [Candidatus Binatia bacterium]|nr:ATP-binding protein [Candidatus Binatia bacterium]
MADAYKRKLGCATQSVVDLMRRCVYERTVPALTVIFVLAVVIAFWHFSHLSSRLVETGALQATSMYSQSIADLRTFYNTEVVERVRPRGIEVTHNYAATAGAIPIPATFTIEFGKHIAANNAGMEIRLYSDYPFSFRKDGGPRDDFERQALEQLRLHPDKPFYRFEQFQGRPVLRYATAVPMKAGCVACHNSHPESPKTDWKVGDIRGVQEIIESLDGVAAQTKAGLKDTFVLLASMGVLGIGGIGLVIGKLRRNSAELEQRMLEETTAEARLTALHEINLASTSTLDLRAVLDLLLEKSDHLLPFIAATTVRLVNRQTGALEPVACRNLDEEKWKAETIVASEQGLGRLLTEKNKPMMVLNAQSDPRSLSSKFLRNQGLVSYLRVPLTAKDRVLGVITFFTKVEHRFTDDEVDLLSALAAQAAMAIYNAQLYEETATAKDDLERANTRLQRQAVELERSNAELEQFAYVSSHDLQEPLRMVASYTQLLARRYKGKLDSDADDFIDYAVSGVKRMQALINALLSYSRVGTQGKAFEPIDCQKILDGTLIALKQAIEESGAEVQCSALPTVMGDPVQLGQLFQNLIGNAIKFRNHQTPIVRIAAERKDKEWLFRIADNGIGFDPQYSDRVFVMFQRLHGKEDYAGTGIGLALCKKIVERHGGRIWVESKQGEGTSFYFTLPA